MEFFLGWLSHLILLLEKGRNYVSIIIAIVSNITVLLSHNIICSGCFMRMSHGINKKASPIASPTTFLLTRFSPSLFLVLQEIFTVKKKFSNSLLVGLDFAVSCVS